MWQCTPSACQHVTMHIFSLQTCHNAHLQLVNMSQCTSSACQPVWTHTFSLQTCLNAHIQPVNTSQCIPSVCQTMRQMRGGKDWENIITLHSKCGRSQTADVNDAVSSPAGVSWQSMDQDSVRPVSGRHRCYEFTSVLRHCLVTVTSSGPWKTRNNCQKVCFEQVQEKNKRLVKRTPKLMGKIHNRKTSRQFV